jgi:ArsR family transcriptional regulator
MDGDRSGERIHARLGALADETRTRLLLLLARHELSVSELCGALQLPQSTVSRHLKVLADDGWVTTRAEGASRYYRLARLEGATKRLWQVVRQEEAAGPQAEQDAARAAQVLRERRTRSQEFFSTAAAQWDAVRADLFGARAGFEGLLALLPDKLVVGDLGCGTALVATELAPYVGRVIAVDESKAMLAAARRRVRGQPNIELRAGALEALPVADGELDAAVLSLVLHYVPEPLAALVEARRVLRAGGRLVVVDLVAHGRAEWRERMGHVWQGFTEAQLRGWLAEAGFRAVRWQALAGFPARRSAAAAPGRRQPDGARGESASAAPGAVLFVCSGVAAA